jgi:hypothetical protein
MTEKLLKMNFMNFVNFDPDSAGGKKILCGRKSVTNSNIWGGFWASKFISSFNKFFGKDFTQKVTAFYLIAINKMNFMYIAVTYARNRIFYPAVIKK